MHRRGRERTCKRFCKKECVAALLSPEIGCKKLPAEPFLEALPGVSVIELLAIESVFQYNPSCLLCDFRRCFCSSFLLQHFRCLLCSVCVDRDIAVHFCIIGSCFLQLPQGRCPRFLSSFQTALSSLPVRFLLPGPHRLIRPNRR